MRIVRVVFLVLFVGVSVASAQPVNPCTRVHVPKTAITLFTTTDLSSKTATEGEEIQLRVDNEIRIDDCLLIAKGAIARGRITAVQKPKSFGRSGKLAIGVESIQTAGATDVGTSGITTVHGTGGAELIGGVLLIPGGAGLFIAPILLPLPGEQAVILAGTAFEVSLPTNLILDGVPVEPPSSTDAHLIVFRTPHDPRPARGKVICTGKALFCFGSGRYMEITIPPGEYKLRGFGPLEFHPGEHVYLRQIPELRGKPSVVRTGGGIFEFFLPQMKPLEPSDAEKRRKNDCKGPFAKPGEVHDSR
ncbi:MAG: hypothetical protein WCB94_10105 [Terriglobales bacterium]